MESRLKRIDSILLFFGFFLFPYIIQYIAEITPVTRNYFFATYYSYVLSFIHFPVIFNKYTLSYFLISLAIFIIPATILCLITLINKFTQKIFLVLLPIVAVYLLIKVLLEPMDPYFFPLTIYYWSILFALIPVLIVNLKPGISKTADIKKASIVTIILAVSFISISIVTSRDQIARVVEINKKEEDYKSKIELTTPKYIPDRVGRMISESLSDKYPISGDFSSWEADTFGVSQIYTCKGQIEEYEKFELIQGLESEQNYSLEEIYSGYLNEKGRFRQLIEKVNLNNGTGVFVLSQMSGASNGKWGDLFFTNGNVRTQIRLSEKCMKDPSLIKEESIKIANSMN